VANKPVLHAHDHQHGGADPVRITWESTGEAGTGGGIQFDIVNTGDWIEIDTTSDNAGNDVGILLYATKQLQLFSDEQIELSAEEVLISSHAGGVTIDAASGGDITLTTTGGGLMFLHHLPTSDPLTPGALWNNSGTLMIS
jgi:hypothetical protein